MGKLNKADFQSEKERYVNRIMHSGLDLETVERYINQDISDEKQAKEMLKEAIKGYEDKLDLILFDMLEVLQMREKFGILNNKINTSYPHPVVAENGLVYVEYKSYKQYLFTDDELFKRYITLQDDIEQAEAIAEKDYIVNHLGTISREKDTMTYRELAEKYNTTVGSISYYIVKYKEQHKN